MKDLNHYKKQAKLKKAHNAFQAATEVALNKISARVMAASHARWEQLITDLRKAVATLQQ